MIRTLTSPILFALLAGGSFPATATAQKTRVADASVTVEPVAPVSVVVTGLTAQNAKTLEGALLALAVEVYACDACMLEQATAGACSKCSAPLQRATRKVLASAAPAPADGTVTLTLNARRQLRLSELDRVLSANALTLDRARQALPGRILISARGGTADKLPALERAMLEAGLFDEVRAAYDAASTETRFTVRSTRSPTGPQMLQAIKVLETQGLQLVDIAFGAPRT